MTYGVPYSFVPGTKAKANEVNANFNDVIEKIKNSESRIDSSDSQIESLNNKCKTLESNISTNKTNTDKSITDLTNTVNIKANNSDIDGFWVNKYAVIAQNSVIVPGTVITYNLNQFLPNDNCAYEVMLNIVVDVTGNPGSYFLCNISSDLVSLELMRLHVYSASKIILMPIGPSKNITISCSVPHSTPRNLYFALSGYRKVR